MNNLAYSTVTRGSGDLRAAKQHRLNVERMMNALWACPKCLRVVALSGHDENVEH